MPFTLKQFTINDRVIKLRALIAGYDVVLYVNRKNIRLNYYGTLKQAKRGFYWYCRRIKEGKL